MQRGETYRAGVVVNGMSLRICVACTHHSLPSSDPESTVALFSTASRRSASGSAIMFDASVTSFSHSLASVRRSAGGFVALRAEVTGITWRLFRTQYAQRLNESLLVPCLVPARQHASAYNGAAMATTKTGIRNAKAVGVMPLCPMVLRHSRLWSTTTSAWLEMAGIDTYLGGYLRGSRGEVRARRRCPSTGLNRMVTATTTGAKMETGRARVYCITVRTYNRSPPMSRFRLCLGLIGLDQANPLDPARQPPQPRGIDGPPFFRG